MRSCYRGTGCAPQASSASKSAAAVAKAENETARLDSDRRQHRCVLTGQSWRECSSKTKCDGAQRAGTSSRCVGAQRINLQERWRCP